MPGLIQSVLGSLLSRPPRSFPVDADDYYARDVGTLPDGTQYFATTGFVYDRRSGRRDFLCLYRFHPDGSLLHADIREAPPQSLQWEEAKAEQMKLLETAGVPRRGRITVRPFSVRHEGIRFGLIAARPISQGLMSTVRLVPGDGMAFCPPWDGTYDT